MMNPHDPKRQLAQPRHIEKGKTGLEMGIGSDYMPYLRGTNKDGEVIWNLGQKPVVNFNDSVVVTIVSVVAQYAESLHRYVATVAVSVRNNTNDKVTFTANASTGISVRIYNPASNSTLDKYITMTSSDSLTLAVGGIGKMEFNCTYGNTGMAMPSAGTEIPAMAYYMNQLKYTKTGNLVTV